ncbi:hypothetical protein [Salinibacterium sp. ZJ454]|uniref:hypothetical protein n=1 Tax=Salinibacterium sp. ZJ454 TaxID=2708339 RepID=UPI001420E3FE|nr:hypothetical protein [Salinibacterium sp. ZJ454]
MEILGNILLVLHFIGLASLLGGFLTQMSGFKTGAVRINPAILHGALTQLVTGVLLVGVIQMGDLGEVDNIKIAVKLVIVLVIYVLAWINRKKDPVAVPILGTIGLLTIANIVIAVFWK